MTTVKSLRARARTYYYYTLGLQDVVGIGDHLQRRADDDAGEQVTEHGAEAELLEDRAAGSLPGRGAK